MNDKQRYSIREICDILAQTVPGNAGTDLDAKLPNITRVVNQLNTGGAYFLLGKNKEDREKTLAKAMKKNPALVIAGKASRAMLEEQQIPHIIVKDAYDAMIRLSGQIREDLGLTVVGVTGSLGKTTTKEMIHSVLSQKYVADKSYGNRNNGNGIFLSLQGLTKDTEFYIQEFGVAIGKKSMESKISACVPNAAVITNISDPHLDVYKTRENLLKEKIKLATEMKPGSPVFLNFDDELLKTVKLDDYPVISYAVDNKNADYYAEDVQSFNDYFTFDIVSREGRTKIVLYSVGIHNVYNAVAAYAVGKWFGLSEQEIVDGIAAYKGDGIRQNLTNIGGYNMYIDCYNNAPLSLVGSVKTLEKLIPADGGKRIAVIGDMSLLGEREKELHVQTAEQIADTDVDKVFVYGEENAELMADVIRKKKSNTFYTNDRKLLNENILNEVTRDDIILFKGPVVRLLSKTVDQVFGTCLHIDGESREDVMTDSFKFRVIWEKYNEDRRTVALLKYVGSDDSVTVPGIYEGLEVFTAGPKSFYNSEVKNVVIEKPVFNIGDQAFEGSTALNRVELPQTLKYIGDKAFKDCTSLEEIAVPEGVIHIGEEAFAGCTNLKKVVIPATVGHIGEKAFEGCADVMIECAENTAAYDFAAANGLKIK